MAPPVALAGEGPIDLAILRRLCAEAGLAPGRVFWGETKTGKFGMTDRFAGWAAAAATGLPVLALRDLDHDAPCAGALRAILLADAPSLMLLRIAVRAAEAWLIADRERLAKHLAVRPGALPADPDACDDPKSAIMAAAARSRRPTVRDGIPPRPGSGRRTGPDYWPVIQRFVRDDWRPDVAAQLSPSLDRARRRIAGLAVQLHGDS